MKYVLRLLAIAIGFFVVGYASSSQGQFILERVGGNYTQPVYVTQAPGDNNSLFVVERSDPGGGLGKIVRRDQFAASTSTFLELNGAISADGGAISMAFHPDFQSNGLFYVALADGLQNRLEEYEANPQNLSQAPTLSRTLLTYNNLGGTGIHTIDWVGFRPGTMELFVTTGDGGVQANQGSFNPAVIESTDTPYGKLLRFDLSSDFTTPAGAGLDTDSRVDVVIRGMRNPWRASFDDDGGMFIGDVGWIAVEEISYVPASHFENFDDDPSNPGNPLPPFELGWTDREGTIPTFNAIPAVTGVKGPNDIDPIFDYLHNGANPTTVGFPHTSLIRGNTITSGYMFQGRFYFGDFATQNVYSALFDNTTDPTTFDGTQLTDLQTHTSAFEAMLGRDIDGVVSFGIDNEGSLYIVDFGDGGFNPSDNTGEIFRLVSLPTGILGDFDGNNDVDELDWATLRGNFNLAFLELSIAAAYAKGDINGDRRINHLDFAVFKGAYEDFNGIGTFQGLIAVPEPATFAWMLVLGGIGSRKLVRKRRKV